MVKRSARRETDRRPVLPLTQAPHPLELHIIAARAGSSCHLRNGEGTARGPSESINTPGQDESYSVTDATAAGCKIELAKKVQGSRIGPGELSVR